MKDFQYYKNWAINHLKKQLTEENAVKKSLQFCELMLEKSFPVGTIREWKGKKYKKVSPGKWMRYFNAQNRGSSQALRNAIKQLEKIDNMDDLAKFVNANRNRFCNEYGKPLPEAMDILRLGKEKSLSLKKKLTVNDLNRPGQKRNRIDIIATDKTILKGIIDNLQSDNTNKKVFLGFINDKARNSINSVSGNNPQRIVVDTGEMRHALERKDHWLEPEDLLKISDIINNTNNISAEGKIHQNAQTIKFEEEVENGVILIMEFHNSGKDLGLTTAYRVKKERVDAPILNNPGQTSETLLPNKNIERVNENVKKNTEKSVKTECKNLSELKNYAKNNYNIEITVDHTCKTQEEEIINSFYEVEKMCKKLPGLNEYIKTIEYANIGEKNNGVYDPDKYKIRIGNFKKNAEFEDFRFATGQDVTTVMQHEMTHAIQQYIFMNSDEEAFRKMFEESKLGDKYIKRNRAKYKTLEDYKFNMRESFDVQKYKFYSKKVCKDVMEKVFKNLGMKPIKFGEKTKLGLYIEQYPPTGKYRLKKDRFTPEELVVTNLSFYSLSDPMELWSEAFTDYLQNGENAQPISKEIWKVVNEDYLKGELNKSILYIVKSILGEYVA